MPHQSDPRKAMPAAVTEQKQGALHVKPGTEWAAVLGRASRIAPDAFGTDRLHNLINGTWRATGDPEWLISPVDGSKLVGLPPVVGRRGAARGACRSRGPC